MQDTSDTTQRLHQEPFTPDTFYTRDLLRQTFFTPNSSHTRHFLHQTSANPILHHATFTPNNGYAKHLFTPHKFYTRLAEHNRSMQMNHHPAIQSKIQTRTPASRLQSPRTPQWQREIFCPNPPKNVNFTTDLSTRPSRTA